MGLIELLFEKKSNEQAGELDKIKKEVAIKQDKEKEIKNEKEIKESKDVKENKRPELKVEKNSQIDELELKTIKLANEIETLKGELAQSTKKILEEISGLSNEMNTIEDSIKEVPKSTLTEMRKIKRVQPATYSNTRELINENTKASSLDKIDVKIVAAIQDAGKINSRDLLEKTRINKTCSKNTLYIHLQKLEGKNVIIKKRAGHQIIYSINEENKAGQPALEVQVQLENPKEDTAKQAQNSQPLPAPQPQNTADSSQI